MARARVRRTAFHALRRSPAGWPQRHAGEDHAVAAPLERALCPPAGKRSPAVDSGCARGESEAVVTMVPSPAARGVVVGGNCAMWRAVLAQRAKLEVACFYTPIRCQGVWRPGLTFAGAEC